MNDNEIIKKMEQLAFLVKMLIICFIVGILAIVGGLLPLILKVSNTTERVEQRFQDFADVVQPVVAAGAGKAVETISQMDAERLSNTATESSDEVIRAAGERTKRFLERNNNPSGKPESDNP